MPPIHCPSPGTSLTTFCWQLIAVQCTSAQFSVAQMAFWITFRWLSIQFNSSFKAFITSHHLNFPSDHNYFNTAQARPDLIIFALNTPKKNYYMSTPSTENTNTSNAVEFRKRSDEIYVLLVSFHLDLHTTHRSLLFSHAQFTVWTSEVPLPYIQLRCFK